MGQIFTLSLEGIKHLLMPLRMGIYEDHKKTITRRKYRFCIYDQNNKYISHLSAYTIIVSFFYMQCDYKTCTHMSLKMACPPRLFVLEAKSFTDLSSPSPSAYSQFLLVYYDNILTDRCCCCLLSLILYIHIIHSRPAYSNRF
jgi:hypothetical protein